MSMIFLSYSRKDIEAMRRVKTCPDAGGPYRVDGREPDTGDPALGQGN